VIRIVSLVIIIVSMGVMSVGMMILLSSLENCIVLGLLVVSVVLMMLLIRVCEDEDGSLKNYVVRF